MAEKKQWYQEYQQQLEAEQKDKSRDEVIDQLKQKTEHVFDPMTAPKQTHNWVDRGLKLSCETASHPYHQTWKRGSVLIA